MIKSGSLTAILAVWICSSVHATHKPVKDPKTQIYIGELDDIPGGDDRIITTIPDGNVSFSNDGKFSVVLGVEEWGPIEVSALLTTYPELATDIKNASLCSIMNGGEDPIIMNSANSLSSLNVTASQMIAQWGILYIFSDTTNKVYGATFTPSKDRTSFNFTIRWNITITQMPAGGFATSTIISDSYNNQILIIKGTDLYFINTQFTKPSPSTAPIYSYTPFNLNLLGTIRYMDAYFGTLVVLTTDELALYTLTPGVMNAPKFVIDGDFNIVDGVLELRDFELNPDRTQTFSTIPGPMTSKIWPYKDYFYNFSISLNSQLTSISQQRITTNLMFLADSDKVHVFDFSDLKSNNTATTLPHPLNIANVLSVRRYHESLYLLRSATGDLTSPAVEVVEVFLLANSVSAWSDPDMASSDLYYVNNVFLTDFNITEIYLDDVYVYMQGQDKIAIAYRGKPSKYSTSQAIVFNGISHPGIGDIGKILVDGMGVYFALLNNVPTAFNMSMSQINITCPIDFKNDNFGEYVIQFNTTTSTCPKKKALLASTLDVKNTLLKGCLLQKNLKVSYSGIPMNGLFPGFDNATTNTTKSSAEAAQEAYTATQKIMFWFYGALAIFLVVGAAGVIYLYVKRRNRKVAPTTAATTVADVLDVQDDKGAQGVYDIKKVTNTDLDFSPSERNTLTKINEPQMMDLESPAMKKTPPILTNKKGPHKKAD